MMTTVVDELLAGERHPDDVDVLAQTLQRLREGHALQAFDDLRTRHAEPEHEPVR